MTGGAGAGGRLIEVQAVGKTFEAGRDRREALRDATPGVREGEFLSVVGPSGCGKSALLRLPAGITAPTAGAVRVGGQDPASTPVRIGRVFRTPALLPGRP